MKTRSSPKFIRELEKLPQRIQDKVWKHLQYLQQDLRHPSLRAKKYDETRGVWQARVDDKYRFYFTIDEDMYTLHSVRTHKD